MKEAEMKEIAALIDGVLAAIGKPDEAAVIAATKQKVVALTSKFPLPYKPA
jgi:glycine hydroxymethyltransferase